MKELHWKDFKIKDLKPNLIENGWDSFQKVGSGVNYVENWNFESGIVSDMWGKYYYKQTINNGIGSFTLLRPEVGSFINIVGKANVPLGEYQFRVKLKASKSTKAKIESSGGNESFSPITVNNDGNFHIYEYKNKIVDNTKSIFLVRNYGDTEVGEVAFEIDWIQITPINNQHLVLEKTTLHNGLTHIKTWGGGENGKLRFIQNSEKEGEPLSFSMYIENNGDDISLHHDAPSINNAIENGYKGFFETQTEVSVGKYKYIGIGTEGNLDFIASEPQFVEGDKANPVLLINELEDGKEHVQVHGAYVDTKLISKEVQGFSGEPYQIKTDIDNEGLELSMTSTLGDKSIDINKGSNSISHTGELKGNRIVVELGAKNG